MQQLSRKPSEKIHHKSNARRLNRGASFVECLESRQFFAVGGGIGIGGGIGGGVGGTTVPTTPSASVLPAFADKIGITGAIDPTPTFADEFDGTSLDPCKWQIRNATRYRVEPNSPEWTSTTPDSVRVSNGELSLIAHNNPATGALESGWVQTALNNGSTENLLPGRSANFTQAFGYWEAKLKMTSVSGMWNAFWVHAAQMPAVGDDPAKANHPEIYGTEMDVVEQSAVRIDNASGDTVHTTTHANGYASQHIYSASHPTVPAVDQYHIYGLLWTPTSIAVFMDGNLTYTETNPNLVSKVGQFVILSNEIGAPGSATMGSGRNSWGTVPAGGYGSVETSTAKLTADYVRVWSLTGSIAIPTVPATPTTPVGGGGGVLVSRPRPGGLKPPTSTGVFGGTVTPVGGTALGGTGTGVMKVGLTSGAGGIVI